MLFFMSILFVEIDGMMKIRHVVKSYKNFNVVAFNPTVCAFQSKKDGIVQCEGESYDEC